VEDNTTVAKDFRQNLEGLGYGVPAVAATGQESIEEAESKQPDAVLMDVMLRNRRTELELYRLLAGDAAFKASMRESLRRVLESRG